MIVAMIPILVLGAIQIRRTGEMNAAGKEMQRRMSVRLADEIYAYVDSHRHVAEALASEITVSQHRTPEALGGVLTSLLKNFPGFKNIYVADKTGKNLAFCSLDGQEDHSLADYDFSSRNYYRDIAERRQTVISPVFSGQVSTQNPLIAIASPIFDADGNFDGYVSAALDVGEVQALAEKYSYGASAYAVVLDQTGKVIYHPDGQLRAAIEDLSADFAIRAMKERGAGALYRGLADGEEYAAFTTLPKPRWLVMINKPAAAYRDEYIQSLKPTAALLIATLGACLTLSFALASALNYPIRLFTRYTKAIGTQNFELNLPRLAAWRMPREMNELADHFLLAARKLKEKQNEVLHLTADLERRVEERTDNLQAVLESMTDAIVIIDGRQTIAYANRRLENLLGSAFPVHSGMKREEFLKALTLAAPDDAANITRVISGGLERCLLTLKKDAQTKKIALTAFAVSSAKHKAALGKGFILNDITEKYEIDQLKNNLISLAAHEFKTPLTGVRGGVETLLRKDVVWDEAFRQEMLDGILEDVLRIGRLVDDWLDISKIDARTLKLRKTSFALLPLLQKIEKQLKRQNKEFTLRVSIDAASQTLLADEDRIEQALCNILSNAIAYSAEKAAIEIDARIEAKSYVIAISDRGVGIDKEHLPHIFERFYRADISSTRSSGGTGLGLAICKGIVEAHRGKITAESERGKGTRFIIRLPLKEDENDEKEAYFNC